MSAIGLSLKEAFYYVQSGLSSTPLSEAQRDPQQTSGGEGFDGNGARGLETSSQSLLSLRIRNELLPLVLTEDVE